MERSFFLPLHLRFVVTDGQSLLQHPFQERRELLHENFLEVKGEFAFARNMDTNQIDEIQSFLDDAVKDCCEGLMVKMLTGEGSSYEPSKRSMNWLKVPLPTQFLMTD